MSSEVKRYHWDPQQMYYADADGSFFDGEGSECVVPAPDFDRVAADLRRAREALADAIECVESWAAYVSPYFQEKHDLAGDLARLRAALSGKETP